MEVPYIHYFEQIIALNILSHVFFQYEYNKLYSSTNCLTFILSPSLKVEQLCVQQENEGRHHGSLSDLHGNFVALLHLGKSVDLLHIRSPHGHSHPLAYQRGLSSPLLQLPVGTDPIKMYTFLKYIFLLKAKFV